MKLIFPILICSAISAALGYYFGHITILVGTESLAAPVAVSLPAPERAFSAPESVTPEPDLPPAVEPEPEPEPELALTENSSAAQQTDFAQRAALSIQTFTDSQGRTLQARIIEVTDQAVKIRRTDGLESEIQLNMLSAEDAAFCKYLFEEAAKRPAAKPAAKPAGDEFDWDAYFNS